MFGVWFLAIGCRLLKWKFQQRIGINSFNWKHSRWKHRISTIWIQAGITTITMVEEIHQVWNLTFNIDWMQILYLWIFFHKIQVSKFVDMLNEEKQKKMHAAERGQDYVVQRFFQDLHRPSDYFKMESNYRLNLLKKIKEESKQPKTWMLRLKKWIEIPNCSTQLKSGRNKSFDKTTWIKLNCIVLLLSVINRIKTRFCTSSN